MILAITDSPGSRVPKVREVLERLLEAGYQVSLLTSCEREDGDDHRKITATSRAESLRPQTWQDAVAILADADLIITNRLHCLIFSFFAKTAVVPLLDREKLFGVRLDANLPEALEDLSGAKPGTD